MANNLENMSQMLGNPHVWALKKYAFDLLQERYPGNEEVITRVCSSLVTKKDTEAFAKLMADFYELGYLKATEQHKELMQKLGYNVKISATQPIKEGQKIFQEKSG